MYILLRNILKWKYNPFSANKKIIFRFFLVIIVWKKNHNNELEKNGEEQSRITKPDLKLFHED